jgi:hypothetical protein
VGVILSELQCNIGKQISSTTKEELVWISQTGCNSQIDPWERSFEPGFGNHFEPN